MIYFDHSIDKKHSVDGEKCRSIGNSSCWYTACGTLLSQIDEEYPRNVTENIARPLLNASIVFGFA